MDAQNAGALDSRAMLARLNISYHRFTVTDKRITRNVAAQHGTDERRGRYQKHLMDGPEYAAIKQAETTARQGTHYVLTLPWGDDNTRILSAAGYVEYTARMRKCKEAFDDAAAAFLAAYPDLVEADRIALNGMFNPADYPTPASIRDEFTFRVSILPLPTGGDFRVQLNDSDLQAIRTSIEDQANATLATAMGDAWNRLYAAVHHLAEQAGKDKGRFFASNITNIATLCDVLPLLNISRDPDLDDAAEECRRVLCATPADVLKKDPDRMKTVAQHAVRIAKKIRPKAHPEATPKPADPPATLAEADAAADALRALLG